MDRHEHWEQVYRTKQPDTVSWYQREARLSRESIERIAPDRAARIVDIGAGASVLVDALLEAGYTAITVNDIASAALELSRARLGDRAAAVHWLAGDVLSLELEAGTYDVWHDRAVFHFLVDAHDRARYVAQLLHAVSPGGHVVIATFAEDGPTRCSGLDVCRYDAESLYREFGDSFSLQEARREVHSTPSGASQAFTWIVMRRSG